LEVKLGDKTYEIRYPFFACREIEKASGKSVTMFALEMSDKAEAGDISFDSLAILVWAGILHMRRNMTLDQVAVQLDDACEGHNFVDIMAGCAEALLQSIKSKFPVKEEAEDEKDEEAKN